MRFLNVENVVEENGIRSGIKIVRKICPLRDKIMVDTKIIKC